MSAIEDLAGRPAERAPRRVKPFYWSVRRELWEYPWLWIAPVAVAGIALAGNGFDMVNLGLRLRFTMNGGSPEGLQSPFGLIAVLSVSIGFVVGMLYCLSAIHGERRDRSALFWRSLPVSDTTAVLAKAAIPLLVLPAIVAVTISVAFLLLLIAMAGVGLFTGLDVGAMLSRLTVPRLWLGWLYVLVTDTLWRAPIFAWLLLISAWARRAPLFWAAVPGLVCVLERVASGQWRLGRFLLERLGGPSILYLSKAHQTAMAPLAFITNPGMWLGLVLAAAFLAAAIWLCRRRSPV